MILRSTPITGRGYGHALGFPTINLAIPTDLDLAAGVYAVRANGHAAVLFFGRRATLGDETPTLEVHVLDKQINTPPATLRVEILEKIRDQKTFPSTDALARAIAHDCAVAARITTKKDSA